MSSKFHICLRALEPADWQTTWSWHLENTIWSNREKKSADTAAGEQEWIHTLIFQPGASLAAGITRKEDDALLGMVLLEQIDRHHRHGALTLVLSDEQFLADLCAREAALLMLYHAFQVLGLERVETRISREDDAGLAWLEASGFVPEARLRQGWRRGSRRVDVQVGSVLRDEFLARLSDWQWPYPPQG